MTITLQLAVVALTPATPSTARADFKNKRRTAMVMTKDIALPL